MRALLLAAALLLVGFAGGVAGRHYGHYHDHGCAYGGYCGLPSVPDPPNPSAPRRLRQRFA